MSKLITEQKPTIQNYVAGIRLRLGNIATSILEIGELYCEALKKYSNARKVFAKEFPNVRETTWAKFKMIGEHRLAASAFFLSDTLAGRLVKSKVPVEVQSKQISGLGVNVYRRKEKQMITVPFVKFTEEDERVFFDEQNGMIRTEKQQKDFVDNGFKTPEPPAWKIVDGGIQVRKACFIPWTAIKDIDIFGGSGKRDRRIFPKKGWKTQTNPIQHN